jgi:hypothetical protein
MRLEFEAAGLPVEIVGVNIASAVSNQQDLVGKCSFPLFQDRPDVGVFDLQGGRKDDFYVYDRHGRLSAWLPAGGALDTTLTNAVGHDNVKGAVMAALAK